MVIKLKEKKSLNHDGYEFKYDIHDKQEDIKEPKNRRINEFKFRV